MAITAPTRVDAPAPTVGRDLLAPIRCLVVDDHPAVRLGLRRMLEEDPRFTVTDAVSTAEAAVSVAQRKPIDVAIVDFQLGGRTGLWASAQLKRLAHPPAVLMYSAHADGPLAAACVVSGVDGLIGKHRVDLDLCDAISDVADGQRRLPELSPAMISSLEQRLDDDERVVFAMLRAGLGSEQIAEICRSSDAVVTAALAQIVRKLGLPRGVA